MQYLDKQMLDALVYLFKGRRVPWDTFKKMIETEYDNVQLFYKHEYVLKNDYLKQE
jgi:hypothetical protein